MEVRRRLQLRQGHAEDSLIGIALARFGSGRVRLFHWRRPGGLPCGWSVYRRRIRRRRNLAGLCPPLNRREWDRNILCSEPKESADTDDDRLCRAVMVNQQV